MGLIDTILTGTSCGEACWSAREDVCRCSCGGVNHGVLRGSDGQRPARTCRIKDHAYTLVAVGSYGDMEGRMRDIERECVAREIGTTFDPYYKQQRLRTWNGQRGHVCCRRQANKAEIDRWPELGASRGQDRYWVNAHLLWVRTDVLARLDGLLPDTPELVKPEPPAFGSTMRQPEGLNPPPLELRGQGQLL